MINEIHKDRDENSGQLYSLSEIAWQSFLYEVEQDSVLSPTLRCIVISHVINDKPKIQSYGCLVHESVAA